MLNNRQAGRRRGRGRSPQGNNGPRSNESGSRIDSRARGNAPQMLEKYKNMAREAQMQGDRVMMEYYLQFSDHYFRIVAESRARFEETRRQRDDWQGEEGDGTENGENRYADSENGDDGGSDDGDDFEDRSRDMRPQQRRPEPRRDESFENRGNRDNRNDRESRDSRDQRPRRNGNGYGNRGDSAENPAPTLDIAILPPALGVVSDPDIVIEDSVPVVPKRPRARKPVVQPEAPTDG